ncbi:D-amino acid oxidase protein [Sporothrix schenckii 1099-18]|uniref:D-amino acid oxidase protein n=1 Tax=Sporothrix schenckii 1099-18 TaxID=1397361 RepID=A0A0F2MA08_SPOSC|nr:D-amino acid oxidase protein [Sporothrix schenckii 1099-18]KJR86523.1 D-amino acid oxidase protein [Sporothrix schenckii 1099-18]
MQTHDNIMASDRPHIVVVGAGIIGASIAWHLAAVEHADVTVVAPAAGIGGTATPNSFAWINANSGNVRPYYELRRRSMAVWRKLASDVPGLDGLVRWHGTIQWNKPADELAAFIDEHTRWGYTLDKVTDEDITRLEPGLSDAAEIRPAAGWAVRAPDEGTVEPALAAQLFVEQAKAKGAQVVTKGVAKLLWSSGHVTGLILEDGTQIKADHVVLAAGLGSVPLCASVGVKLPVHPRPGLLAHTKPISTRLLKGIILSAGPHVRQTVEGRLVIGADFAGGNVGNESPDEQRRDAIALVDKAKTLFRPEDAALLDLDFFTVGERPQPGDGLPIVDAAVLPGLAVAVMHSGVTLAAVVGELLAKAVVRHDVDPILEAYSIKRFGEAG